MSQPYSVLQLLYFMETTEYWLRSALRPEADILSIFTALLSVWKQMPLDVA
jgi:hypothetical protein